MATNQEPSSPLFFFRMLFTFINHLKKRKTKEHLIQLCIFLLVHALYLTYPIPQCQGVYLKTILFIFIYKD